ncbi:MAG: aminotransferase class I/II-fold pyridoxal phosphate-dependent enzyme [Desulfobacteraceae bacterium]|jgi:aspartate/methionine/tyrosine aminotransferase|nr:aminotransferase class I/II-fold pyridoxal phosphate-dependent enzyme [Desulfobacteraceae bacterium]
MQIPAFKLERYFARYEFNIEHLLCASDCESLAIQDLLALEPDAAERFHRHWLGYTESMGKPSLRKEICRLYHDIHPNQVLVHTGAEEAIFLFMHAVLNAKDHVIVQSPCYQSLAEIARSIGCRVSWWNVHEDNGWALDIDELKHSIQSDTRAIIINTPHNPTGYLMPSELFQMVNRIARENGIILFSDEVYRESEYQKEDRLPAACELGEHSVSLGVMSKTYGLPGLRIGWIATQNEAVYNGMAALKDYTTICNSAPSEFLSELALRHREKLVERNLRIIIRNLGVLDEFFARYSDRFAWQRPKAGAIGFPRLLGLDVEAFCKTLVRSAGVLLLPGTLYDDKGNHFRIGFGRKNLPEAIARLEAFLQQI